MQIARTINRSIRRSHPCRQTPATTALTRDEARCRFIVATHTCVPSLASAHCWPFLPDGPGDCHIPFCAAFSLPCLLLFYSVVCTASDFVACPPMTSGVQVLEIKLLRVSDEFPSTNPGKFAKACSCSSLLLTPVGSFPLMVGSLTKTDSASTTIRASFRMGGPGATHRDRVWAPCPTTKLPTVSFPTPIARHPAS